MTKPAVGPHLAAPHATGLHAGAVIVAVASGLCALVALAVGSPLQFGSALAVFAAGWIAADFLQSTTRREPAAQRCAAPTARLNRGPDTCRVVHVAGDRHFSRPVPRTMHLAA